MAATTRRGGKRIGVSRLRCAPANPEIGFKGPILAHALFVGVVALGQRRPGEVVHHFDQRNAVHLDRFWAALQGSRLEPHRYHLRVHRGLPNTESRRVAVKSVSASHDGQLSTADSTGGCNTLNALEAKGVLQMERRPRIHYSESQR